MSLQALNRELSQRRMKPAISTLFEGLHNYNSSGPNLREHFMEISYHSAH